MKPTINTPTNYNLTLHKSRDFFNHLGVVILAHVQLFWGCLNACSFQSVNSKMKNGFSWEPSQAYVGPVHPNIGKSANHQNYDNSTNAIRTLGSTDLPDQWPKLIWSEWSEWSDLTDLIWFHMCFYGFQCYWKKLIWSDLI